MVSQQVGFLMTIATSKIRAVTLTLACVCVFIVLSDPAADSAAKKDPMVASMLLANFICAFYTNVLNLVDERSADLQSPCVDLSARCSLCCSCDSSFR
jgi:hypothetical protein